MGMFDTVRVKLPLPDGFDGELQSKDGPCTLATIEIREDGTMWSDEHAWWDGADAPRTFVQIPFHGYFSFGGIEYPKDHVRGTPILAGSLILHEYVAKFTDGKLVEIVKKEVPR